MIVIRTALSFLLVLVVLTACAAPGPTGRASVEEAPPAAQPVSTMPADAVVIVPAGTSFLVRLNQPLDTRAHSAGYKFTCRLEAAVAGADGNILVPAGTPLYGEITKSKRAGRIVGKSEMYLRINQVMVGDQLRPIVTTEIQATAETGSGKANVGRTAGAAAIGGLAGGSSGAKTGAKVGLAASLLTRGDQINLPAGTLLQFSLAEPVWR